MAYSSHGVGWTEGVGALTAVEARGSTLASAVREGVTDGDGLGPGARHPPTMDDIARITPIRPTTLASMKVIVAIETCEQAQLS
jgi:hypothetical protein